MAILYQDDFESRTVGAVVPGWTAYSWVMTREAPYLVVSGTKCVSGSGNPNGSTSSFRGGFAPRTQVEYSIKQRAIIKPDTTIVLQEQWHATNPNGSAIPTDGYAAVFSGTASNVTVTLNTKTNSGAWTYATEQSRSWSVSAGDTIVTKLRVDGRNVKVKIWNATVESEPAEYTLDYTDPGPAKAAGHYYVKYNTGDYMTTGFDDFVLSDLAADTTAPTLTNPTTTATGATTASGSVSTNEANGTLYWLASANATELAATVKAGSSHAVKASGVQNVTVTGLTASTSYYLHFVHTDAAANDSAVATSGQFTTSALDTTPPTLTGPTGTATGATTASGTVSTNEDAGTLYWLASANASETGTAVKAGSSQAVSAVGTQNVTVSGLTASTAYYLHYLHRDAAGNDSTVATSAQFTTDAAPDTTVPTLTGSVTFASITQTSYTAQWPAGADNVAVTGYEYQIGGTAGAWTNVGNTRSVAITGRTAGTTETVYVRAYDAEALRSTPAISGNVTLLSPPQADINVTEPLKNNAGMVLASQSGVRVAVLRAADLVSVYETSGLTTNASGILATISNAAITTGQQYHVAIKLADGSVGITGVVTAS